MATKNWTSYFDFMTVKKHYDVFCHRRIIKYIFDNILEASTGPFYIKIMRFAGFFRVQIHSWNANVS